MADTVINNTKIDLGTYINADDIAVALKKNKFSFAAYKIKITKEEILAFAASSGLLNKTFTHRHLSNSFTISNGLLFLKQSKTKEQLAQILARFLRECMLKARRRFSFETVFSHPSNLDIMRQAVAAGYKVYLYFVSTESPDINKYRVQLRVAQNGHDVPEDKIESRYYRSLELLYDAAEIAYQVFFFDNSREGDPYKLVNHFKKTGHKKTWDSQNKKDFSGWFKKYYWSKYKKLKSL